MSRLYIRVMTGFYTHRKTVRLFSKIGPDAFWLPPRLWAYCAENQPDGNLSGYEAEELAMLVAYKGDASSMLVALKDCGFMDLDGMIHDWKEHNGYHEKFAVRARTAAEARWSKKEKNQKKEVQGKGKGETSIACSMLVASDPLEVPESLKTQEFMREWAKWQTYRREMKGVKNWVSLFREQLDHLKTFDARTASEMLRQSIRNGWKGIFDVKTNGFEHSRPQEQAETWES